MARLLAFVTANILIWPCLIVVPMSFSNAASLQFPPPGYWLGYYARFFGSPNWTGPLLNSFVTAGCTVLFAMTIATPAAFALVRHRFFGKKAFRLLVLMPMLVPHIVLAVGYYTYFGKLGLVQSYPGIILAHTCITVPVATMILAAALQSFDRDLERAATSLGSPPLTTFRLVTLPVMRPAFLVAALFVFIHSFDEAVISLFISGRDTATLPRQMFNSFAIDADPAIAAASSLLFAFVLVGVGIAAATRLVRRRVRPAAFA